MRVLFITGSPRNSGNTYQLAKVMESIMGAEGIESSEIVQLSRLDIQSCRGCRICFQMSENKCPIKDSLLQLKDKMECTDLIIVGSPVYVEDVTGLMKNWIDRMAFNTHRPFLCGKPVYIYTTSASGASGHALHTLKNALVAWGAQIIGTDNYILSGEVMQTEQIYEKYEKLLVKKFHNLTGHKYQDTVTLFSLIGFNIQKKFRSRRNDKEHGVDYRYWKERGWLEKKCRYYKPVQISCIRLIFAKLLAWIISCFVM